MKTYTVQGGVARPGIPCDEQMRVPVGECGRGRKLTLAPLPRGSTIEWTDHERGAKTGTCSEVPGDDRAVVVLVKDHSGYRGSWSARDPRTTQEEATRSLMQEAHEKCVEAVNDATRALAVTGEAPPDHGPRVYEARQAARQANGGHEEYDCQVCRASKPVDRPPQWKLIVQGACAQGDAGRMGGGAEYLAVLQDGQAVEVVRSGRLYGATAVLALRNIGGELVVVDVIAERAAAKATAAW